MSLDRICRNGYVGVCLAFAGLVLGLAVSVFGETTSTWNNLGGDGEYANPANWNPVVVPLNDGGTAYLVVIPASASVSYDFPVSTAGTITSLTLGDGGTLTIDPAESLTVLGDADVAGRIVANAGTFSAGAGSQFVGNKATLAASNGGNLTLPATSYSSTGITGGGTVLLFSATGAGSVLDLSSLESLADNHSTYNSAQVHQVSATNDGVVNLSSLQQVSGPTLEEADRLEFVVNTGGNIVLTALQSTTAGTGEVRFSIDVPSYTLPALQTAVNTQFNVSGTRTLNLPALVSHSGQGYTLGDGATVNAPALASLTNAVLTLGTGSVFAAPNLTDVSGTKMDLSPDRTVTTGVIGTLNNARISVSGGFTFGTAYGDVSATSYSSTGITWAGTEALFSATGPGSVLDLSSLESLADNHSAYNGAQVHQVSATNNGVVNLSKVQHISGPLLEAQDRLDFIANTGGRIDLSSLQSITTGTGKVRFVVSAGGQLSFGDLTMTDEFSLSVTDATSRVTVGDLYLDPTSSLTVGGGAIVALGGHFSFDYTDESRFACDTAIFQFDGNGTQWMEVGGEDLGLPGPTAGNFGITQLIVGAAGRPTDLILVDLIDNGNRHSNEALYLFGSGGLDGLEISTGSRLIIGDINVYALVDGAWVHFNEDPDLILNGSIPYDGGSIVIPEPATLALLGAGVAALVLRHRGR
jgi:hypothetical protein